MMMTLVMVCVLFSPTDACDLTMDPNTVNYNLTLSDDNNRATRGAWQSYPDHPERFVDLPQVLCKEGLTGRHYWEVEWGDGYNEDVAIGVAYKGIQRKQQNSYLGVTNMSWCFGLYSSKPELFSGHEDKWGHYPVPSTGCKQVGVYLDCPAGTLSFYHVSSNTLTNIHTFYTTFTEPVYPGCYIKSERSSVLLCPVS